MARIAGPQHGVVARRQLLAAGLARRAVDHLIVSGSLVPVYRGVYGAGHRPVGPRSREMAVVLHAGRDGVLGRESAAGLWAMLRWRGVVHAIGPRSRRGEGFVIRRTRDLPPEDIHPRRAFETDRERDIVLAAAGHRTVRVTDRQLTQQRHKTAQRFQALLTPTQRR